MKMNSLLINIKEVYNTTWDDGFSCLSLGVGLSREEALNLDKVLWSGGESVRESFWDDKKISLLELDSDPLVFNRLHVIIASSVQDQSDDVFSPHLWLVELLELVLKVRYCSRDGEEVGGVDVSLVLHSRDAFLHGDRVVEIHLVVDGSRLLRQLIVAHVLWWEDVVWESLVTTRVRFHEPDLHFVVV